MQHKKAPGERDGLVPPVLLNFSAFLSDSGKKLMHFVRINQV
jgi:hypothetical protein